MVPRNDRYYEVASLIPGESIIVGDGELTIRIDDERVETVVNDEAFKAAVADGRYFWISGGGTFLIGQHLLVVKRGPNQINAGRFSLFTGRADSIDEWLQPTRLIRELFEEVRLSTDVLLYPRLAAHQGLIDDSYRSDVSRIPSDGWRHLPVHDLNLPCTNVTLLHNGTEQWCLPLPIHIGPTNDINLLQVLRTSIDLEMLHAECREDHGAGGRQILALDATNGCSILLSGEPRSGARIEDGQLTDHCRWVVQQVRKTIKRERP